MKKYIFRKYSKDYPKIYQKERKRLLKILPRNTEIEHIGSTAVPTLEGKGIIDLMIAKEKSANSVKNKLIKNNYVFKPNAGDKNRLFFESELDARNKHNKFHIHLIKEKNNTWKDAILFREMLKNNKKIAKEYSKIKKEAIEYAKDNGKKYRKYKDKFIKNILKNTKWKN